ncbi:hypothetical protein OPT61_g10714 [Boeremia exigua]|uniref:Uncharacterized protein n=1 Tax=Boeremia exigua TaxID=749465 RepID=A0ACC2HNP5_9PLEO|nr:hypothetical protein OPT61_g10714 [Boeremia exigua]
MVYLPRADDDTCRGARTLDELVDTNECQRVGERPYCWPPNGTLICPLWADTIYLYWPSKFYHSNATLSFNQGSKNSSDYDETSASRGRFVLRNLEEQRNLTQKDEQILRITIHERYTQLGSVKTTVHQGPTLTLASPTPTATSASGSYSSGSSATGRTVGILMGSFLGVRAAAARSATRETGSSG